MKSCLYTLLLTLISTGAYAQGYPDYNGGLKFNLDESGEKYFRLITWHQVWARYNENNAGSTRMEEAAPTTFDFGIRRSRFLMYAQIDKRFLILTHFGINNQNAISGGYLGNDGKRPQVYMHDVYVDYTLFGDKLHIGAGLHYWNGLSRATGASTLNFLTLDAPIFNWPTIEATDQFARRIGMFAYGKLGRVNYQFALTDPFKTNTAQTILPNQALYSPRNPSKVLEGYVSYAFFESESNLLPYRVGTYLGSKKVFNLGGGFMHNADAMWYQRTSGDGLPGDTAMADMTLLSVDAFLDLPLRGGKGGAITAYAVAYFNDFGPNKIRHIGIMNPADGGGALRGNALPTLGTGNTYYIQLGYMLPRKNEHLILQPYVAMSHSQFEALRNEAGKEVPVTVLDVGGSAYLAGHHCKLTINYRHRPDFTQIQTLRYRPEVTLQAMIYL